MKSYSRIGVCFLHNGQATFCHPLWPWLADQNMVALMLAGKMNVSSFRSRTVYSDAGSTSKRRISACGVEERTAAAVRNVARKEVLKKSGRLCGRPERLA